MSTLLKLIKRNIKLFFKDKGMFFTSLITPVILLVLYLTFLGNVYRDIFTSSLPEGINLSEKLINGLVGGQVMSSILAVSCVTIAFCSNFLMVQDKTTNTIKDLKISPVKSSTLSLSYYIATLISTLIICFAAMGICLIYMAIVGWYLSFMDVLFLFFDIILLVLFGTALSSIINFFLSSQGQISAVGTIISAGYGFICGAYMPIRTMGQGMQYFVSLLPGTYATVLFRQGFLNSVLNRMRETLPQGMINGIASGFDVKMSFFGHDVSTLALILVISISTIVLLGVFLFINKFKKKN